MCVCVFVWSRDSAVSITTGCGSDGQGVEVRVQVRGRVCPLHVVQTKPPVQRVPGTLSPGVKRLGREADQSPLPSTEVKITWNYTTYIHSTISFHGVVLS
jgi:hypothetical protein